MQCKSRRGFTIVEIMIAMLVFSIAALMTTAIVIGMSRQYQKGSYTVQLNDASRSIHQDIRDTIAYGGTITRGNDGSKYYFCTKTSLYYWNLSASGSVQNGLYKRDITGLDCTSTNAVNGVNILPSNGFVSYFNIDYIGNIYDISTRFNVGTSDMYKDTTNYSECLPTLRGGDFCAVVNYNSSVMPR